MLVNSLYTVFPFTPLASFIFDISTLLLFFYFFILLPIYSDSIYYIEDVHINLLFRAVFAERAKLCCWYKGSRWGKRPRKGNVFTLDSLAAAAAAAGSALRARRLSNIKDVGKFSLSLSPNTFTAEREPAKRLCVRVKCYYISSSLQTAKTLF